MEKNEYTAWKIFVGYLIILVALTLFAKDVL
jgi:hypothetical protein